MSKYKKNRIVRCESWCRHYFRDSGAAVCGYGNKKTATEKGAPCLGRREVLTNKSKEEREKEWQRKREEFKKEKLDKRCRRNCVHYSNNSCRFGPEPAYTEDGAQCIGRKEISRKKKRNE